MILSRAVGFLALAAVSQAQEPFRITGAKVYSNSTIPLRMNINDLQTTGGPQWDLYLQSVAKMYQTTDRDPLSFFQIAGIHGMPFQEWNHTGGQLGDGWLGYCPHGEPIFCLWHRPYVMLFEQILVSIALEIAETYPPAWRQQYRTAAQTLRSPYWEWSFDSNVPPATVPERMTVNVPHGDSLAQIQISNPLNSYTFPNNGFDGCGAQTVRCPAPDSYPSSANSNMGSRPFTQWTYDVMTQSNSFESFASTGFNGVSLETMHNAVHWDAACGQQFLAPDCSGFDPLFFLHHSFVDLLYAYWEVLNPDKTVFTKAYQGQSRWNTRSGTWITPNSPLQPFYDANGESYTSKSVASGLVGVNQFGYAYVGMESDKTLQQMQKAVATRINERYKPQDDSLTKRSAQAFRTRHLVKVVVNVEDIAKLPCNIEVCMGDTMLGSVVIMKLPAKGTTYNGFSIDKAVKDIQASDDDAAKDFYNYFKQHLDIKIKTADGGSLDPSSIKSLEVRLEQVNVTNPQAMDQLPKVINSINHGSVTPLMIAAQKLKAKLGEIMN